MYEPNFQGELVGSFLETVSRVNRARLISMYQRHRVHTVCPTQKPRVDGKLSQTLTNKLQEKKNVKKKKSGFLPTPHNRTAMSQRSLLKRQWETGCSLGPVYSLGGSFCFFFKM